MTDGDGCQASVGAEQWQKASGIRRGRRSARNIGGIGLPWTHHRHARFRSGVQGGFCALCRSHGQSAGWLKCQGQAMTATSPRSRDSRLRVGRCYPETTPRLRCRRKGSSARGVCWAMRRKPKRLRAIASTQHRPAAPYPCQTSRYSVRVGIVPGAAVQQLPTTRAGPTRGTG
jgi:hypothetical protein